MKPYYQRGAIVVYLGDCREVLPRLAPDSVDLIVTDPPYGVRWDSNHRRFDTPGFGPIAGDHSTEAALEGLRLALRVLRHQRHVYAFGRYDLDRLPELAGRAELIWDKVLFGLPGNRVDANIPWTSQHEYIQFAVYTPHVQNRERGGGRLAARLRRGSILRHQRPNALGVNLHPTEKPVPLLRELIEASSCMGETVLDPFVGVGSTLVAAQIEGRGGIGIELDERYCEIAARRLDRYQEPLFDLEQDSA